MHIGVVCVLWSCSTLHASTERLIHVSFHVPDGHVIGCDIYIYFYFRSASRDSLQYSVFRRSHFRISEHNCSAWSAPGYVSVLPMKCLDRTPNWATTAFHTFWLMNYWLCDVWGARSGAADDSSLLTLREGGGEGGYHCLYIKCKSEISRSLSAWLWRWKHRDLPKFK